MEFYGAGIVTPDGKPIPLSSAVEVDGFIFLSGVLALRNGKIIGGIEEQTDTVIEAIGAILERAGLSLDHIIKTTIWLTDPADFAAFNAVYASKLKAPFPPRSCVVSQLVAPGARVEIEVIASRNQTRA